MVFVKKKKKKKNGICESLVAYWLGLGAFTAVIRVQSLVRQLRSHKPRDMAKKTQNKQKLCMQIVFTDYYLLCKKGRYYTCMYLLIFSKKQ